MKVGIKLGKVKKFGIGWCIPHRVSADKAEGGSGQTPPAWYRVNAVYNSECPRCRQNLLVYDCCQIFVQILIPQTYKKICFVFRIAIAPMWIILARKGITTMGWLAGLDCSNWLALITSRLLSIVEIDHIFSILLYFNLINMTLFYYIILYFNLINIAAIDWLW